MNERIGDAAWLQWPQTQALVAAFKSAGEPLRFVGGCVRDSLLKRPVSDVDAATPAEPEQVAALIEQSGFRSIPTGLAHGTVTALIEGHAFEITTLRRDVNCDGRRAAVAFTQDWCEDAARRDFTINALYADPDGTVIDYFGGLAHLSPVRIIFIGEPRVRIEEDALRMLRYFRFSAQLAAKPPDAHVLAIIRDCAPLIEGLSGERIAQEMLKLLAAPCLSEFLLLAMQKAGVLTWTGLPSPPSALRYLFALEAHCVQPSEALSRLALWLMTAPEPAQALIHIASRWKLATHQRDALRLTLAAADALREYRDPAHWKRLLRRYGAEIFRRAALAACAQESAAGNPRQAQEHCIAMLELERSWVPPMFPVTGGDLLERGFTEGPALGRKLAQLEEYWEAQHYRPAREELLALLRQ